jgi:hypothetical protein
MELVAVMAVSVVVGACASLVAHYLDSMAHSQRRLADAVEAASSAMASCAEELERANALAANPPFTMQPEMEEVPERKPAEVSYVSDAEAARREEDEAEEDSRMRALFPKAHGSDEE